MAPTSKNARKSAHKSRSDVSGDDYLANQISDARLALESTLDDLTLDVARAADLRRWVRRYPWAALGTALVAGFTLAHVVTKSKRREEPAEAPDTDGERPEQGIDEAAADKPEKKQPRQEPAGGWRTTMLNALFDILRLIVTQFISASVRKAASGTPQPRPMPSHDGANADPHSSPDPGPDGSPQANPAN
jgi:hypothetical protein